MATVLEERIINLPEITYNKYQLVHKYSLGGQYHVIASSSDPNIRPKEIFTGGEMSPRDNWEITKSNIRYLNDLNKDGLSSHSLEIIKSDDFRNKARHFEGAIVPYKEPWSDKGNVSFRFKDGIKRASFYFKNFDEHIVRISLRSGSNYEFRDMMFPTYFFEYWKIYLWAHFRNGPHSGTNVFHLFSDQPGFTGFWDHNGNLISSEPEIHFLETAKTLAEHYGLLKR